MTVTVVGESGEALAVPSSVTVIETSTVVGCGLAVSVIVAKTVVADACVALLEAPALTLTTEYVGDACERGRASAGRAKRGKASRGDILECFMLEYRLAAGPIVVLVLQMLVGSCLLAKDA